jgi:glycosyltransferase involved in cell wall biosynthesis
MGKSISILIPAYNAQGFIEECLDSIQDQTYFKDFDDYEILVGIDGCKKTKEKLLSIRDKYKNLRILEMDSNKGTYITFNTLIASSKYEVISTFGADDIMLPLMIEDNIKILTEGYDAVSNQFEPFMERNTTYQPYGKGAIAAGVVTLNKTILSKLGGFQPWPMSADVEFLDRIQKAGFKRKKFYETRFKVRVHGDSMTNKPSSRQGSKERVKYNNMVKTNKILPLIYVKPITNSYKEI